MSLNPIYVEASDEITTVIERLRQQESTAVALVAPKGAALLQSIVNLKLIKKAAKDAGKEVILVSTDKIGRNLATQVGLPYASTLEAAREQGGATDEEDNTHVIGGVRIHRYYEEEEQDNEEVLEDSAPIEPIIPKRILKETVTEPEKPAENQEVSADTQDEEPFPIRRKPIDMEAAEAKDAVPAADSPEQPDPLPEVASKHASRPVAAAPLASSLETPGKSRKKAVLFTGLVVSLLLIGSGISLLYLPYVEVTARVPATPWQKQVALEAAVSRSGDQIPATLLSAEASLNQSFDATGTKEVGEKAAGTATIFNGYSSDSQKLAAGTVISFKGHDFTTNADLTVPGARVEAGKLVAGSASVGVTAALPGPDSNLSNVPGTISSSPLYAQLDSATGGSSKEVAVVTEADITKAKAALEQKLRDAVSKDIAEQSKGKDYLVDESSDNFAMADVTVSVEAGSERDSGEVRGKASLKRLAVAKNDALQAADHTLKSGLPEGTVLNIKKLEPVQAKAAMDAQTVSLVLDAAGTQSTRINTETLPKQLAGKTFAQGTDLIHPLVHDTSTTISRKPGWWPRLSFPYLPTLIRVHVEYE